MQTPLIELLTSSSLAKALNDLSSRWEEKTTSTFYAGLAFQQQT